MTFRNLDALMDFFEQIATDKMREFETGMLLRDDDEITDDIADVIDGCREWHEEAMVGWRVQTRRQEHRASCRSGGAWGCRSREVFWRDYAKLGEPVTDRNRSRS